MKTNYKLTGFGYSVAFISMVLWSYLHSIVCVFKLVS